MYLNHDFGDGQAFLNGKAIYTMRDPGGVFPSRRKNEAGPVPHDALFGNNEMRRRGTVKCKCQICQAQHGQHEYKIKMMAWIRQGSEDEPKEDRA
jgi:hypothetical protein